MAIKLEKKTLTMGSRPLKAGPLVPVKVLIGLLLLNGEVAARSAVKEDNKPQIAVVKKVYPVRERVLREFMHQCF